MLTNLVLKLFLIGLFLFGACPVCAEEPVSGYAFLTPETREMQDDEFLNPGMSTVEQGEQLFHKLAANGKSCASCHGKAGIKLDTQRVAEYPVYSIELEKPLTLQEQVHICWGDRLDNDPLIYDCKEAIALETYVKYLSRGQRINVDISGPMSSFYKKGEELYYSRFGQLDMACAHCHVYHQGQRLRGQVLNQGQSNGFPEYRLGTGRITSFHRRITECFVSFRAQPYDLGSDELINLEVYVNAKGNGLKIETPAVRY